MGNCIDLHKPILWVDDDEWGPPESADGDAHCSEMEIKATAADTVPPEPVKIGEAEDAAAGLAMMGGSTTATTTEIKIKIGKKQLEDLLRQAEEKGMPIKKVLADLAVGFVGEEEAARPSYHCGIERKCRYGRHWRPNLQSIPEVSD